MLKLKISKWHEILTNNLFIIAARKSNGFNFRHLVKTLVQEYSFKIDFNPLFKSGLSQFSAILDDHECVCHCQNAEITYKMLSLGLLLYYHVNCIVKF